MLSEYNFQFITKFPAEEFIVILARTCQVWKLLYKGVETSPKERNIIYKGVKTFHREQNILYKGVKTSP